MKEFYHGFINKNSKNVDFVFESFTNFQNYKPQQKTRKFKYTVQTESN